MLKFITAAGLAVAGIVCAPTASANPMHSTVCSFIDEMPTSSGVAIVGLALMDNGFTAEQAGTIIGEAVTKFCPRNIEAVKDFLRETE